MLFGIC